MADDRRLQTIHRTVQRTKGYWRRAGVPRKVRRQKADELRDHLEAAVADGREVHDVTGRDLAAFAAEWAQAEVQRPWLEPLLLGIAVATLLVGGFALVWPFVDAQDRTGIPAENAVFLVMLFVLLFGLQLVRWFRAKLTIQRTAIVVLVLGVVYFVPGLLLLSAVADAERFVAISPTLAWALVGIGTAAHVLATWLKRTGRL